ncbi:A24 family peptidase [Halalkalicoccus ordinarius]|uniref:A24 family peptidase n=1 Tax=Halalkalicoccus ordinarius TaxID=3116651 RepID=UPI00300EC3EF
MIASVPDLLRLLALPVLAWAAWRDVEIRRVPGRTWLPLAALGVVLLVWDGANALAAGGLDLVLFAVGTAISLLVVVPAAYLFWRFGAFGGADAKALIVLAVLFPTFPVYDVGAVTVPLRTTPTGAFALTILSNTVLVGACYPLWLALHNAVAGRFTPLMAVGRPVAWDELPRTHGRLLEGRSGFVRSGLDLDALRMYLRWRGETLAELRGDPDRYRRPDSLPAEPLPAGDGAVATGGESPAASELRSDGAGRTDRERPSSGSGGLRSASDDWGADAFLTDVGSAYGTTPEGLREGLELLTTRDRAWVSPGIPFLVPILVGLAIGLTYGDLLIAALGAVGLV